MSSESQHHERRITVLEERVLTLEQGLITLFGAATAAETDETTTDNVEIEIDSDRQTAMDAITHYEKAYDGPTPVVYVLNALREQGCSESDAEDLLDRLIQQGTIYEPQPKHVRVV